MKKGVNRFLHGGSPDVLYVLAIFVIVIAVFAPFFLTGRLFITQDMAMAGAPILDYVHEMAKNREFFAWNPYLYSGLPTIGSSMGAVFYPLNAFFFFFRPRNTILVYFVLHVFLGGWMAYLYLRSRKFNGFSSFAGALLYAFAAARLFYMQNFEQYGVLALSPLILLLIDRMIERYDLKSAALFSLGMSVYILSGGLNLLMIFTVVFIAYGIYGLYKAKRLFKLRTLYLFVVCVLLVACMTAVMSMPLWELLQQNPVRKFPLAYREATMNSMTLKTLAMIPFTHFYGDYRNTIMLLEKAPCEHFYVAGFAGLLLTMLALAFPGKRRKGRLFFFLAAILLGFFLALGNSNPLYPILYRNISFFNRFRCPTRLLIVFPLFITFAGAVGVERLQMFALHPALKSDRIKHVFGVCRNLFAVLCAVYGILFLMYGWKSAFTVIFLAASMAFPLWAIISAAGRNSRVNPAFLTLLVAAALMLNIIAPVMFAGNYFITDGSDFDRELKFLSGLKKNLEPHSKIYYTLNPESPQMKRISNIGGNMNLVFLRYVRYLYAALYKKDITPGAYHFLMHDNFHPLVLAVGEGFMGILPRIGSINWDGIYYEKFHNNPMYRMLSPSMTVFPGKVFSEKEPYPRFWISKRHRVERSGDEVLAALMKPGFNPEESVLLEEAPSEDFKNLKGLKTTGAEMEEFSPDRIRISLNGVSGWLTLSDNFYPGWKAYVDGRRRKILRGNFIFRTVPVRAGERELILRYEPRSLDLGVRISLTGLAVSMFLVGAGFVLNRNESRRDGG